MWRHVEGFVDTDVSETIYVFNFMMVLEEWIILTVEKESTSKKSVRIYQLKGVTRRKKEILIWSTLIINQQMHLHKISG